MKTRFTRTRFEEVCRAAGFAPRARLFDELHDRYAEPHRAYHTAQHIEECLDHLDEARTECDHPDEVELALWFHDAIYDTRRFDNEERSAEWALRELGSEVIRDLILVTRHHAAPLTPDEKLLVDIDLAILGASAERFLEYEHQIRIEYSWVPDALFRSERAKVLRSFLSRPSIYSTEFFRNRLESRARENLARYE